MKATPSQDHGDEHWESDVVKAERLMAAGLARTRWTEAHLTERRKIAPIKRGPRISRMGRIHLPQKTCPANPFEAHQSPRTPMTNRILTAKGERNAVDHW